MAEKFLPIEAILLTFLSEIKLTKVSYMDMRSSFTAKTKIQMHQVDN